MIKSNEKFNSKIKFYWAGERRGWEGKESGENPFPSIILDYCEIQCVYVTNSLALSRNMIFSPISKIATTFYA